MKESKKFNKKWLATIGIIAAIIVIIIAIFAFAKPDVFNLSTESAEEISSRYDETDYGSSSNLTGTSITSGGSYNLSGKYSCITVNTTEDVLLNLDNAEIICDNAPAIYVEDANTVSVVFTGTNKLTAATTEDLDGAFYSKDDTIFSGTGSLEVQSNYDGIVSKDTLVIRSGAYNIKTDDDGIRGKDNVAIVGGTFTINAGGDGIKATNEEDATKGYIAIDNGEFNITSVADGLQAETNLTIQGGNFVINSQDDGVRANGLIEINGGTLKITAVEGIEATYIKINDGTIDIAASDDGINAAYKSAAYSVAIEINGGNITINMGAGDTDGIDSNGNLYVNGGTININCNSPFDYDGAANYTGGTIITNGTETNTITNSMMGGSKGGAGGFNKPGQFRK